jgi:hypothetical protein
MLVFVLRGDGVPFWEALGYTPGVLERVCKALLVNEFGICVFWVCVSH